MAWVKKGTLEIYQSGINCLTDDCYREDTDPTTEPYDIKLEEIAGVLFVSMRYWDGTGTAREIAGSANQIGFVRFLHI
jgi:hypothetical protein